MGKYRILSKVSYGYRNLANVRLLTRMRRGSKAMASKSAHLVNLGIRHGCILEYEDLKSMYIDQWPMA
jgi:hypothetical protein